MIVLSVLSQVLPNNLSLTIATTLPTGVTPTTTAAASALLPHEHTLLEDVEQMLLDFPHSGASLSVRFSLICD